jgi:hypothetical protein
MLQDVKVTNAATIPLTLDDLKLNARVDGQPDATLLTDKAAAAVAACELYTSRPPYHQSYEAFYDCDAQERILKVPRWPLTKILAFELQASDGSWSQVASGAYQLLGARIYLYPAGLGLNDAFIRNLTPFDLNYRDGGVAAGSQAHFYYRVQFEAGYDETDNPMPASMLQGIYQLTTWLYDHRDGEASDPSPENVVRNLPPTVRALWYPLRVQWL